MSDFIKVDRMIQEEPWFDDDHLLAAWLRSRLEAERKRAIRRRPHLSLPVWRSILTRFQWRCAYCGARNVPLAKDHRVPYSKGGATDATNIVPACVPCNSRKHDDDPSLWPLLVTP